MIILDNTALSALAYIDRLDIPLKLCDHAVCKETGWTAFQCEPQMDADKRKLTAAVKCFTAKSAKFAKTL